MGSLEDRLQEILKDAYSYELVNNAYPKDIDITVKTDIDLAAIAQIKQVFKDEGYISPSQRDVYIDQVVATVKKASGIDND